MENVLRIFFVVIGLFVVLLGISGWVVAMTEALANVQISGVYYEMGPFGMGAVFIIIGTFIALVAHKIE